MPLLGRHAFIRQKPPSDLKRDEEVFYCKLTHEVFRDYNAFFERIILCNSLVWTCALSGRPGLTYQEALESEKEARKNLSVFPSHLKRPILFLATLTRRGRLADLCDDVFVFLRDRFLIGENVEAVIDGVKKHCCVITKVIPIKKKSNPEDAQNEEKKKPPKKKLQNPSKYKYEVTEIGQTKHHVVKPASLSRKKGSYTREKSKLFLKQHIVPDNGVWKVKEESASNFKVNEMSFKDIFAGPLPSFFVSPKKNSPHGAGNELKNKDSKEKKSIQSKLSKELMDKNKTPKERAALIEKQRQIEEEERIRQRIELKKRVDEEKQKRKEERVKEREKLKEEKKLLAQVMMEWKRPRDDLECDDLKNLPIPTSFDCSIPQELFGDVMMVLEFLHLYGDLINLKDSFPQGFTFDHMERALTETDIQGCLNDLIQVLLAAIFQLQEEDEEDLNENNLDCSNKSLSTDDDDTTVSTIENASELASLAATWPILYHGAPLRKMPIDSFSLTEILRLHFLSAGASNKILKIQGITSREDPGLWMKIEQPEIVKKLSSVSLFELPIGDKVTVLKVLVDQILTSSTFHDTIDENFSKVRHRKNDLKQLQFNYKKEKEETAQRYKKLLGDKTKDDEKVKDEDKSKLSEKKDGEDAEKRASSEEMDTSDIKGEDEIVGNEENLPPEEREELCKKRIVEEAKKKEDFLRKEREIQDEISKLQHTCSILPLGRDRAYRKFWLFNSLPGLFVEEGDSFVGTCLSNPTPYNPNSNPLSTDNISQSFKKKLLQNASDDKSTNSDKENESVDTLSPVQNNNGGTSKIPKFNDAQNSDSSVCKLKNNALNSQPYVNISRLDDNEENVNMWPKKETKSFPLDTTPVYGMCTSCPATCPVHNTHRTGTKWGFYYTQKEVEDLLSSLNQRGFREGVLRETILTEKKRLEDIEKCPVHQLNRDLMPPSQLPVRKSNRLHGNRVSAFKGIKPKEALELTLRDMILELEERISIGCLGVLKVENRDAWRNAIEYRISDKDCASNLSENLVKTSDIKERNSNEAVENNGSNSKDENMGLLAPIPLPLIVKNLSNALVEVALGIEYKYLQPPLGDDEETKRQRLKLSTELSKSKSKQKDKKSLEPDPENDNQSKPTKLPLKRWEESLRTATSLSQIFVHMSTLERSVVWSRSVLKARCKICRRCSDAENMLLCDGCNRGHHIYCLKPPLMEIPECDWYCSNCKPVEKPLTPRKKRVNYEESDLSEESNDESEYSESEDEEDSENDIHGDLCDACHKRGTLICCDSCPLAFHLNCVEPPLKRIPRGSWHCHKCSSSSNKTTKLKEAAKQSSGAYRTRAQAVLATAIKKSNNKKSKSTPEIRDRKRKAENDSDSDYIHKKYRSNGNNTPDDSKSGNNSSRRLSRRTEEFMFDYKACSDTLNELTHHKDAWPFLRAVSRTEVPSYYDIIKRPMDFGTVQGKLNNMQYQSNKEFLLDIYLILQNCEVFNPRVSSEYKAGRKLYVALQTILESHGLDTVDIKEKDLLGNLD